MYNENPAPRAKLLSLLVAVACSGLCATAVADPTITLTAAYALNGVAQPNALGEGSLMVMPHGADFYLSKADSGSSVFFHTYGFTGGSTYFGARASGEGLDFFANTSSLYSGSYTNTGGSAALLNFAFYVDSGSVGLFGVGVGSANVRLQVRRNGSVVGQGDTLITQTLAGITCSETDIGALGDWANCSSPSANSANGAGGGYAVNMGLVAAGETITIDYDIIATVSGQYVSGAASSGNCYGGYGNEGYGDAAVAVKDESSFFQCVNYNGIARSGDPFNGGQALNTADFLLSATAVELPEPGSLALLAAAAGGWWISRRRRSGPAA